MTGQAMASSASLIEDISVELLVCHLCLDQLRFPKTLSCRHSFCEQCLRHLGTYPADDDEPRHRSRRSSRLTCPVCYESCLLPAGGVSRLPDDPVVTQLCSIIERRKSSAQQLGVGAETACQICSRSTAGERHRSAHVKCVECGKMMCSACARLHRRTAVCTIVLFCIVTAIVRLQCIMIYAAYFLSPICLQRSLLCINAL